MNKITNLDTKHKELRENLLRDYNHMLIEKGYGIKRRDLKQKDFVDMRPITIPSDNPVLNPPIQPNYVTMYDEFYQKNNIFYNSIPCFNEGVYQTNKDRYIYWNIKNIDIPNQTYTVFIMDYMQSHGIWQPGTSCISKFIIDDNTKDMTIQIAENELFTFSKIYKMIPYSDLKWSNTIIKFWKETFIRFAITAEEKFKKANTNHGLELSSTFIKYTNMLNCLLTHNKPKAIRRKSTTTLTQIEQNKNQPKKLIRKVDTILIKSEKPPKPTTEKTIIKYKTATWKTRGHIRTLKSGKQIYVKESTHHRHCLQNQNITPPQSVIQLKTNKKGN